MEKQKKWAGWLVIGLVVAIAVTALAVNAFGNTETDDELAAYESRFRQLFPYAGEGLDSFERMAVEVKDGLEAVFTVLRGGQPLGYVARQTVEGYGGPIELIVGMRTDGTLAGVHVGGPDFNETEGLGAKAKEPEFTDQFVGKTAPLQLGENIDAIAGATVTSQAVVDGVNLAASHMQQHVTPPSAPAVNGAARTANASVIGYGGPVLARVTLDENGAITAVDLGGVRFMETEGVGSRVREDTFTAQFTGKTPPLTLGEDIEAVSGATISSQAAIDAVNEAVAFLMQ